VPYARGEVLEIGLGSGLNLPFYDRDNVTSISAVEPDPALRERAAEFASGLSLPLRLEDSLAETLPFEDDQFDTVVSTFTLCSISGLHAALCEMRRVLKRDGALWFAEHGIAPDRGVRTWQTRLTPIQRRLGGGCRLNVDIPAAIEQAGFRISRLEQGYVPGPKVFSYHYWGRAEPGAAD
jgi:ubiquinone/menaquinone biosynthesis C-methylase UbiE